MVYTPMGGSPTIIIMVYTHFGGSHKVKIKRFTMGFDLIVKIITHKIKDKYENISV